MFRVITGTGGSEPLNDPRLIESMELDPFAGDEIPFVEVGGPEGAVGTAAARKAPAKPPLPSRLPPVAPKKPEPVAAPHAESLLDGDGDYLSVSFHAMPKPGLRLLQSGIAPEVVAYHFPDHPITGEYRKVRDAILGQFEEPGARALAFTAASPISGTTTVLINFAVSLCMEHGSRVLLVDTNFARPGVARRVSCAESPGLAEVLGQSIPLAWALQPTPLTNLHVLAAGTATDATEEALVADFPKLIAQLRQWFDWVVIDAGVWAELPGAEATGQACDAVYMVSRHDQVETDAFAELRTEITTGGSQLKGYVATK
jgi:Mrp family chromosome partitioning ATPase